MARLSLGTSGWVYGAWKGRFYPSTLPDAQRLGYYANRFGTTEVNYSFYHVPTRETYRRWLTLVPAEFVFALKANCMITHVSRLRDVESAWNDFARGAEELGPPLGPILLQFPPFFRKGHAADFAYLPYHGQTPRRAPLYGDEALRAEARFVDGLLAQGIDTYVYFNNDALAHAPMNATRLGELLGERRSAA